MIKKLFFLSILAFVQGFSLYSCEESKSDELEVVDLTLVEVFERVSQPALHCELYPGFSCWRGIVSVDEKGERVFVYDKDGVRIDFIRDSIDEHSLKFKKHEHIVEVFAAASKDDSIKLQYYSSMICDGMWPCCPVVPEDRADRYCFTHRRYKVRHGDFNYCNTHHCYQHKCLLLYAYQAYLLQPADMKVEKGSVDEAIQNLGRSEVLRRVAPQSTQAKPINIIRKLHDRSLGAKPGMKLPVKSPVKQELK